MDSRTPLAARIAEIAPFHVMEVQTAARALEAAGPHGHPHGDRRARFPDAAAGARRRARRARRTATSTTRPRSACRRCAKRSPRHYARALRRRRRAGARHRHRRLVGRAAARAGAARRPRRRDPAGRPRLSVQPPLRARARRRAGRRPGRAGARATSSMRGPDRAALDAANARRADRLAVESDRHDGRRATRCARSSTPSRRAAAHLIVDEIYLGLSYDRRPRSPRSRFADDALRHLELLEVLQHDRLAARLDRGAGAPRPRSREARAEPLHLAADGRRSTPRSRASRPRRSTILEARRDAFRERRDFLVPALRELGFAIPVTPGGGFFVYADCSRVRDRQPRVLPRRARGDRASRSRPASTSAAHRAQRARALRLHDRRRQARGGRRAAEALPSSPRMARRTIPAAQCACAYNAAKSNAP